MIVLHSVRVPEERFAVCVETRSKIWTSVARTPEGVTKQGFYHLECKQLTRVHHTQQS